MCAAAYRQCSLQAGQSVAGIVVRPHRGAVDGWIDLSGSMDTEKTATKSAPAPSVPPGPPGGAMSRIVNRRRERLGRTIAVSRVARRMHASSQLSQLVRARMRPAATLPSSNCMSTRKNLPRACTLSHQCRRTPMPATGKLSLDPGVWPHCKSAPSSPTI